MTTVPAIAAMAGSQGDEGQLAITPIPTDALGKYVGFELAFTADGLIEPMYSEDALGPTLAGAIKSMCSDHKSTLSAARRAEVMETWEARLIERGHHYILPDKDGWKVYGDDERGGYIGAQNAAELFAVNMYGARKDKISAAGSRTVPGIEFFPKRAGNPLDTQAADEANKYKSVWASAVDAKSLADATFGRFYTDGRVLFYTRTVADEQAWGLDDTGRPAMREITSERGKLEHSLPVYIDDLSQMGWVRVVVGDFSNNTLKEKFPWIEKKIGADGQSIDSYDSLERTARLSVKGGTRSGITGAQMTPETHVWLRPSEYRSASDDAKPMLRQMFPSGMEVAFAGSVLAYVRNASISDSIDVRHSRSGDGQNRRAIGTNNIPVQKVLNKSITLFNRIVTAAVPRRYGDPEKINVDAANQRTNNDATQLIPMLAGASDGNSPIYIEQMAQQNAELLAFIAILRNELPAEMDGATEAMFGMGESDTLGEAILNTQQALQVFGTPYVAMGLGFAKGCEQAVRWAAKRGGQINAMVPSQNGGQERVSVDLSKIRGQVQCFPESNGGIPESESDVQARTLEVFEQSPTVPFYNSLVSYPRNLLSFKSVMKMKGVEVPGADSVLKQITEIEKLKTTAPLPNPAVIQAQAQLQAMEGEAQAPGATPEMQQGLQAAQQQVASMPQLLPSIQPVQDASENHQIEAAICLWWMNSPEGQKYKSGQQQEQAGFQNVYLHWQAHDAMVQKLAPPAMPEVKPGMTVAVDKLGPAAQAQVLQQEYGIQVDPASLAQPAPEMQHEIVQEKTGIDAEGIPTKTKISLSPGGKVN